MTRKEAIEMLNALNMMLRSPNGEPISDVCDALGMAIEALSAEAVQGWIPCSERLPKANEVVILCGKYNMFCGYHNTKGEWYSITGDGWETDMDFPDSNKGDILAWMPLPEPYKVE